jgi:hypothetical protein
MQNINIIDFIIIAGIYGIIILLYALIKTIYQTKKTNNKPSKF